MSFPSQLRISEPETHGLVVRCSLRYKSHPKQAVLPLWIKRAHVPGSYGPGHL